MQFQNNDALENVISSLGVEMPPVAAPKRKTVSAGDRIVVKLDSPPKRRQRNAAEERAIYEEYLRNGYSAERDRQRREAAIENPRSINEMIYGAPRR